MEYELLLINISRDFNGYSAGFKDCIGQYLLAAYLKKHSYKAYVYSGTVGDCKMVIEKEVLKKKVPIVGFYTAADNMRVVKHAIQWIKKTFPHVKTLVGGPQTIGLDYRFFEETGNDFAIIGEGEIPVKMLLDAVIDQCGRIDQVPALVMADYKEGKLIVNQCGKAVINDLDSIPYPSMEDSLAGTLRQNRIVGIITGRGCPYQCTFCYEGANAKNVRLRSISNVMEEIDYIVSLNPRLEYISIYDDTFTLKRERVLEFCQFIKKRQLKWFCEGHIEFVLKNLDVLKVMIDSGLSCIQFGIESGSRAVLDAYNKRTNFQMISEAIKACKKAGINGITGNFIIGGAFETKETLRESRRLAKELIDSAKGIIELYVVYFAPYPNTKIVNSPEEFGMVICPELQDINLNTMRSPVVKTTELSTLDIYKEKQEFEKYVQDLYYKASINPEKSDVLQGLYYKGERVHVNPTWEHYYLSQPHVATFIEHLSENEQNFSEEKYIIRTFEDIVVNGETLITEVGEFLGLEKDILMNATGIYTAQEMAELFAVSISEIEANYKRLNERCFVYMSEF